MSPNKEWFKEFKGSDSGMVLLRNNKACKVLGTGSIKIQMFDGCIRNFQDVRYVPKLNRNLIFIGMLTKWLKYQGKEWHNEDCERVYGGYEMNS